MPATYTDRLEGLTTSVAVKPPCRVATTANITLYGLQTIDGVALAARDRVLVKDQSDLVQNGIWLAQSAAWIRASDFNGTRDAVGGTLLFATEGAINGNTYWRIAGDGPIDINLDEIEFEPTSGNITLQSDLSSPTGSSLIGTAYGFLSSVLAKLANYPEAWGAKGDGSDDTAAIQALADYASNLGVPVMGGSKTYSVGTVKWSSNTSVIGLKLKALSGAVDNAPFFVDGQAVEQHDITFTDCWVDGNRVGQTAMTSSDGDGQRAGFKIFGRARNVSIIRPRVWDCATDGIFVWTGTVIPADADDLLIHDLLIDTPDVRGCGRHGISLTSHKGTTIRGGVSTDNGKDVSGWSSGAYSDGGYGRRQGGTLAGALFGRGLTHEGYFLGEHFESFTVDGLDARGNVLGVLLHAVMYATKRSHKNLRITNCRLDDPTGGLGDGSLILYAVLDDGAGNRTAYTGNDAFDGVRLLNNEYGRNYVSLNCLKNWSITGRANLDPAVSVWSMWVQHHGPADEVNVSGGGIVNGYVLPFTITDDYSTWTSGSATTDLLFPILQGRHRVRHTMSATMAGSSTTNFMTATLDGDWRFDSVSAPAAINHTVGPPLTAVARQGTSGLQIAEINVKGDGTSNIARVFVELVVKELGS